MDQGTSLKILYGSICALLWILDAVDEIRNAGFVLFRFQLGHGNGRISQKFSVNPIEAFPGQRLIIEELILGIQCQAVRMNFKAEFNPLNGKGNIVCLGGGMIIQ